MRPRRPPARASRSSCALVEPGGTERELQVALEATFLRSGGDSLAFESIVAAGDHSAVLHFSPTSRELKAGELLLVDAGAEYRGYASDVTRTYPIGGELEARAADRLGDGAPRVRGGDRGVPARRRVARGAPGRRAGRRPRAWSSSACCGASPRRSLESGAVTLFFPHGVGHMVGLGVRDAGVASDEAREPAPGFPRLRLDIPLAAPPRLDRRARDLLRRRRSWHAQRERTDVDWDRVDALLGFGGVRIEQDVLITEDGCEVLTADIPL